MFEDQALFPSHFEWPIEFVLFDFKGIYRICQILFPVILKKMANSTNTVDFVDYHF